MHNSFVVVETVVQEAENVTGEISLWENMRKNDFFYVMYRPRKPFPKTGGITGHF